MPGALRDRDELQDLAVAAHEKMRGYASTGKGAEIRMGGRVEPAGKQALHRVAAEFARWQADCMQHQKTDSLARRALVAMGRLNPTHLVAPPVPHRLHGYYGPPPGAESGSRMPSRCIR